MPYVHPNTRRIIDFRVTDKNPATGEIDEEPFISFHPPETPGELNYIISKTVHEYMGRMDNPSYTLYNEVVGVLECAKLELMRTHIGPYEEQKRHDNGDL